MFGQDTHSETLFGLSNMEISEIVNGENFKSLADLVIDSDCLGEKRRYKSGQTVFCKTDFLSILFSEIQDFDGELTLISHLSDYPITETLFNSRPKCIKKWFAQNTDYQHPDLVPIPIGIPNHKGPSFASIQYLDQNFIKNSLPLPKIQKNWKIYCNFGETHLSRAGVRDCLSRNALATFEGGISSSEFYLSMNKNQFVASPRGNGIDCHRTWEALLVDSTPIVDKHFMYDAWNIPVIQVTDWNNLELKIPKNCSTDALYMSYWRDKICG